MTEQHMQTGELHEVEKVLDMVDGSQRAAQLCGAVTDAYNVTATANFALVIGAAAPTVSAWRTASAITYGQTLASSVLSGGTASVVGNFALTTPTTVPGVGTAPQSVTFTPTDTTDYTSVTGSVQVTVNSAASPIISSLSPALIKAASSAFTLTVNGSNFASGATVLWNGSSRSTTFVSASQLTASITAQDIASADTANITVVNSGGGISSGFVFVVDTAAGASGGFTVSSATTVLNVAHGQNTQLQVTLSGVASGATVTEKG